MEIAKTVRLEQCLVMTRSNALKRLAQKDNFYLIVMFAAISVSHISFQKAMEPALTVLNTKELVKITRLV